HDAKPHRPEQPAIGTEFRTFDAELLSERLSDRSGRGDVPEVSLTHQVRATRGAAAGRGKQPAVRAKRHAIEAAGMGKRRRDRFTSVGAPDTSSPVVTARHDQPTVPAGV